MAPAGRGKLVARMVLLDARQRLRYGRHAPQWAARIWVDPRRCTTVAVDLDHGRRGSGQVIGGPWRVAPIETVEKLRMAEEHWRTGASWDDVGAVAFVLEHLDELRAHDGYRSAADVRRRFEHLDEIFEQVRREQRLRPRSEGPGRSVREHRGVYLHVGADGEPVFGNGGCHRLAMARALELPEIPAQLGVVHPDALRTWRALRSPAHG